MSAVKQCTRCGAVKAVEEFSSNKSRKDGKRSECKECEKAYHERNKEKRNARRRAYHEQNKEKENARARARKGASPSSYMHSLARFCKIGAKKRGFEYLLPDDWFEEQYKKQNGLCYYTGKEMRYITGRGRIPTNISIDRVDSSLPYTPENCVLCCFAVNIMKNDLHLEELYDFAKSFVTQYEQNLELHRIFPALFPVVVEASA